MMRFVLGAWAMALGTLASAQLDTIRMVSLGGPADEGAVGVMSLGVDAVVTGFTDSNSMGGRAPWVVRVDSNLHVIWQRTLPIQGTAVGSVHLPDGTVVVASRQLLPAAGGYGVHWSRLDAATGSILDQTPLQSDHWLLPQGLALRGDTLITWLTDYSSGTAQPAAVISRWEGGAHQILAQPTWGTPGVTESLAAGAVASDRLWLATTVRSTQDSARARIRCADLDGSVLWAHDPEVEGLSVQSNAISVVDSMAVLGMTRDDDGPTPKPIVAVFDTSGSAAPVVFAPSNPAQVRGVLWNAPEWNGLFRTELFGLGEGDMIFVRFLSTGAFVGAMSFGWEEREEPAAMMKDGVGAVWLVGSTEHGNPNVHIVRAPNDQIGDHELVAFETVLEGPLSVQPVPGFDGLQLVPNPARDVVRIEGVPCDGGRYVAFTLHGTVIATGKGTQLDVSSWPTGTYLIDFQCEDFHQSLRLLRW